MQSAVSWPRVFSSWTGYGVSRDGSGSGVAHYVESADRARWLFIVDGIFTLLVAVWLVAYLPGDVTRTRGRWTKYSSKGWFDQRQQTIAVTRTIRDDPTKIKYLTTRVSWNDLKDALTDRFVWGHLILTSQRIRAEPRPSGRRSTLTPAVISLTPGTPLQTYLPTVIKTFNYST